MRRTFFVVSCSFFVAIGAFAQVPHGVVTTVAGVPGVAGYWDGPASDAMFTHPTWLDVVVTPQTPTCDQGKSGEIFVVDRINQLVRRISESGDVSTFNVRRTYPTPEPVPIDFDSAFGGGILVEPPDSGCGCGVYARGVFIVGSGSQQIVLSGMSGDLANRDSTIILGTGQAGSDDSPVPAFHTPIGISRSWDYGREKDYHEWLAHRRLYIADSGNHTIRTVGVNLSFEGCPQPMGVGTLAGSPGRPGATDGIGRAARFNTPRGIATGPDGSVYVTDAGNHTIRKIAPDARVTTIAGVPGVPGSDDTHLNTPSGIDVNANGEIFFVDTFNHVIRMITADGKLVIVAGQLGVSGFADGDAAAAKFNAPVGLKIAPDGSIVIADTGNNVIRRLTLSR